MTIKAAATLYNVSPQAIYQRLKAKGYDIKKLKMKSGELTAEGEKILDELFDRTVVTGETNPQVDKAEQGNQSTIKEQDKESAILLQVESLKSEVESLKKQIESLKEERDFLRRALDQSQQLHAMTMRMLPPAPVEKKGMFSRLFGKSKKEEATVQPSQSE